jgi:hypothetical protein
VQWRSRPASLVRACLSVVAIVATATGCDGWLTIDRLPPRVSFDAGRPSGATDAGPGDPPSGDRDGGAPPTASDSGGGLDAGPMIDPCDGLTLEGTCDGDVARFCDDDAVRSDDCGARGATCGLVEGLRRCVAIPSSECGNEIEQEQLRLTNAERVAAGLGALVCDLALTRAARAHSQDMCDQEYFSHTSADGRDVAARVRAEGATFSWLGENIARGQRTPAEVHSSWMGSPGHRANIMSAMFARIGIGYVECPGYGPLWTQDFTD